MAEQVELELSPPARTDEPLRLAQTPAPRWARGQVLIGAALCIALVWSMWVTRELLAPPETSFVAVRLSSLVGEYVQAQARSASPPEQVQAETKAFMAALDEELQRRGTGGQVVLVGEAVLSKNVPDITNALRLKLAKQGFNNLRPAAAQESLSRQPAAKLGPTSDSTRTADGDSAETFPVPPPLAVEPAQPPFPAKASVSTFGGPDGSPRR